tara:strand:- start:350 stop:730 length:381 start_codon:yes stop_codon:yes gene_type:complete
MNSKNGKKLTKMGKLWVKAAIKDMKKREKKKKQNLTKKRKKRFTQKISLKKYKELIKKKRGKKRLTKREKKILDDTLFYKYCKCNLHFEKKKQNGYGICMNSVYKNRGFKTPTLKRGNRCKDVYKK